MRQLTSLDAQFLALESARQAGHVGGLAILDPSTAPGGSLDCEDIKRLMEERLPLLPPMRWRLAEVPLGLDYPYWVEDPDFDLDFHVRELALPSPGSDRQLISSLARSVWMTASHSTWRPSGALATQCERRALITSTRSRARTRSPSPAVPRRWRSRTAAPAIMASSRSA